LIPSAKYPAFLAYLEGKFRSPFVRLEQKLPLKITRLRNAKFDIKEKKEKNQKE